MNYKRILKRYAPQTAKFHELDYIASGRHSHLESQLHHLLSLDLQTVFNTLSGNKLILSLFLYNLSLNFAYNFQLIQFVLRVIPA